MKAYERLLHYIKFETASDETREDQTPSTPSQKILAKELTEEMKNLGFQDVYMDEHAYVYGRLLAVEGYEKVPHIGFIAHLDTVSEVPSATIQPQIIAEYDGKEIVLGESGKVIDPERFPHLKDAKGKTIITTDGTTILGADDKAGIAEIITMCEQLIKEKVPHGTISVCFTPDEEIGHGAELMDLERFDCKYAFTVDGSEPNLIEYETFYAASAKLSFQGFETHPGSAKDVMINALLVAMEANAMLPEDEIPARTEGYEGFYHLHSMTGNVSFAKSEYIIRDHNEEKFLARKKKMQEIAEVICKKYGKNVVTLELKDQYQNMAEVLKNYPDLIQFAQDAIRGAGLIPASSPVRGGTDGAQLSFRGLPCPNLGTGGYAYHGPYEHVIVEQMDQMVEILCQVVQNIKEG